MTLKLSTFSDLYCVNDSVKCCSQDEHEGVYCYFMLFYGVYYIVLVTAGTCWAPHLFIQYPVLNSSKDSVLNKGISISSSF